MSAARRLRRLFLQRELDKLTALRCKGEVITNVTGLEAAVNLQKLSLLSPLADLEQLIYLELDGNRNLSDLSPIKGNRYNLLDLTDTAVPESDRLDMVYFDEPQLVKGEKNRMAFHPAGLDLSCEKRYAAEDPSLLEMTQEGNYCALQLGSTAITAVFGEKTFRIPVQISGIGAGQPLDPDDRLEHRFSRSSTEQRMPFCSTPRAGCGQNRNQSHKNIASAESYNVYKHGGGWSEKPDSKLLALERYGVPGAGRPTERMVLPIKPKSHRMWFVMTTTMP